MGFFPPPSPGPGQLPGNLQPPVIIGGGGSPGVDAGAVSTALSGVLSFAGNVLTYLKGYVDAIFGSLFGALHSILGTIVAWLRQLKDSWLGKIITSIWQRVKAWYLTLRKWAHQINDVIQQIKRIHRQYFDLYIKPILNLIQRLRQVLLVFRVFHLKFAERLDNYLAGLESRITKNFLRVYQDINRLSDYINIILDPLGRFHTGIYLNAAKTSITALIGLIWGAQNKPLGSAQNQALQQSAHQLDAKSILADDSYWIAGQLPPNFQAHVDAISVRNVARGYPAI